MRSPRDPRDRNGRGGKPEGAGKPERTGRSGRTGDGADRPARPVRRPAPEAGSRGGAGSAGGLFHPSSYDRAPADPRRPAAPAGRDGDRFRPGNPRSSAPRPADRSPRPADQDQRPARRVREDRRSTTPSGNTPPGVRRGRPAGTERLVPRPVPGSGKAGTGTAGRIRPVKQRKLSRTERAVDPVGKSGHGPGTRGKRVKAPRPAKGNTHRRMKVVFVALLVMLCAAVGRLVWLQAIGPETYAALAEQQRSRTYELPAQRGAIQDRNGIQLAFTIEGRFIAAHPNLTTGDEQREQIATILVDAFGNRVDHDEIMTKLRSGSKYVYLARDLLPAETEAAMAKIKPLLDEKANVRAVESGAMDVRQYPDGDLAAALVGKTNREGVGIMGLENRFDGVLAGQPGSRDLQVDGTGKIIPGSITNVVPARDGAELDLTLDTDLQYAAQEMLVRQVAASRAKMGMFVVTSVKTNEVLAMGSITPGEDAASVLSNKVVVNTFEPGSVNKVVAFAAALEAGQISPSMVKTVQGDITIGNTTVHDAWPHGPIDMTVPGIMGKSSNVGTLMISEKLGQQKFADMLAKLGIGKATGIEIGGESSGQVPARDKKTGWSTTTFANLPIGQGLSMSLIQLATMYQAIGNDGVRIPPTIVRGTTTDGVFTPAAAKTPVRAMSTKTANTLLDILRAPIQDGDQAHKGTAPTAAITGYQVAGKTGTAQQNDPVCKCYSDTNYNATFAGLVPADDPQFVIAIMLDAPQIGSEGGTSAAPLFHDIAAYTMRAYDVQPSGAAPKPYDLYVNLTE